MSYSLLIEPSSISSGGAGAVTATALRFLHAVAVMVKISVYLYNSPDSQSHRFAPIKTHKYCSFPHRYRKFLPKFPSLLHVRSDQPGICRLSQKEPSQNAFN